MMLSGQLDSSQFASCCHCFVFIWFALHTPLSKLKREGNRSGIVGGEGLKMVEIVISVAGKVAEYLVAPVGHQFSYLCNYRSNVDNLKKEFEKLRNEKERVQHLVNDAERNGEEILQNVQKWLISVNVIIDEVGLFVGDEEKAKRQCLGGLCPDLKIRYQLSKKARKEMMVVTRLLAEGKFDQVSYRIVPENVAYV
ncbi:hypothetical protein EZV62_006985 [Acer yangbiense]|uniref:Rx N-terminal domain-containing protein n=1 Tax=Acer yangbiense TaxID=1000413 RepID=A0A5C7I8L1_9ROSI|nr:hypothetical protein EZV62_006985 [Acer yangbiense]